jgi:prepilin-type N-terminal cleavage/methylation domain-containing protein
MNKGFTLVEILLAVALSAVFLPVLIKIFSLSLFSVSQGEKFSQAYALAQEQMEAIYEIRDQGGINWDWTNTPSYTDIASGEYYQPNLISGKWLLGTKKNSSILPSETGGFIKKIEINEVKRDVNGNLYTGVGSLEDKSSRFITVLISWKENGKDQEVKVDSLVTYY